MFLDEPGRAPVPPRATRRAGNRSHSPASPSASERGRPVGSAMTSASGRLRAHCRNDPAPQIKPMPRWDVQHEKPFTPACAQAAIRGLPISLQPCERIIIEPRPGRPLRHGRAARSDRPARHLTPHREAIPVPLPPRDAPARIAGGAKSISSESPRLCASRAMCSSASGSASVKPSPSSAASMIDGKEDIARTPRTEGRRERHMVEAESARIDRTARPPRHPDPAALWCR